jgi:hypothetical protein
MRTLLKLSVFVAIIILIAIGCQKALTNEDLITGAANSSNGFNATFAKEWYYGTFAKSAEFASNNQKENGKKFPDWKNGIYHKSGNLEIIEFPLFKEKAKILIPNAILADNEAKKVANASLRRIVFIKNTKNEIVVREIYYVPDWRYLQKEQFDISKVAFGKHGDNFTGTMIIKKWNEDILNMRILENGKITHKVNHNKDATIAATRTECVTVRYCMVLQDCNVNGEGVYYNCGEPYFDLTDCYEEQVCNEIDDDPCGTYGCGGGGGSASGASVQNVINQLTTPCLVNIFNQITETKLKNQITKLFTQTFIGNGDVVNFKIIEVPSLTGSNGLPQSAQSFMSPTPTGVEWGVILNSSFVNTSSKEYIGLGLIHEIVHSFAQLYTIRTGVLLTDSASHAVMFETWVDQMRDALVDIFGINSTDATALALQGMDDILQAEDTSGNAYYVPGLNQIAINKYGMDLISARTNSDQYQNKTKGTGCP